MASITDGSSLAGGLAISTTSKAARQELFNALGGKLTRADGSAYVVTDEAMPIAGLAEGNIKHIKVDRVGAVAVGAPTMLLTDSFEGTTLATSRWNVISSAFVGAQTAAAGHLFNSASSTAASAGYGLKSLRSFAKIQRSPLHFRARARIIHFANAQAELGFGDYTVINGAHTNGAYWQYTPGGVVQPILMYNTQEIPGAAVTGLNPANYYTWDIIIEDDAVVYTVQDTSTGQVIAERTIQLPITQPKQFGATRLFAIARIFTTASAPASGPQMILANLDVFTLEAQTAKPWKEQMAGSGYGGGLNPTTFAQTSNWANSTAPTSATLSNTVAGYTTLGGLFQFAAVAGANTDYALFGFQVPSPYSFICTGIDIETYNLGAAVATTPTLLLWGIAHDLPTVSLVSNGPRFLVGAQDFQIGAAIGARATTITKVFDVPAPTNPGRFIDVMLRMPVGTATASQVIQGAVHLRGYFD